MAAALRLASADLQECFEYAVRPAHGRWEIRVGDSGHLVVYATREDAVEVAQGAAKLHWATCRQPCGATIQEDDHVRTLVRFDH